MTRSVGESGRRLSLALALAVAMSVIGGYRSPLPANAAYDPSASMSLPFPTGATVNFNGPHNWNGTTSYPWNSLDLESSPVGQSQPVYAGTAGTVHTQDCSANETDYVRIDPSGNNTGWQTTYVHLINIPSLTVYDTAQVTRGQLIGYTGPAGTYSCGSSSAYHTHMSIWYVASGSFALGTPAQEVDWGGVNHGTAGYDVGNQPVIGDWVWTDGSVQYDGTATDSDSDGRAQATSNCGSAGGCLTTSIYNDGDIPGVPGAPTNVTVAATGPGSFDLTWTAAPQGGSQITSYTVTPYIGSTAQASTTFGNVTQGVVYNLTNATAYTATVTAANSAGSGPASSASASFTPSFTPTSGLMTSWAPGRLDVIAMGAGGTVKRTALASGTWYSWVDQGKPSAGFASGAVPTIISSGVNQLDMLGRGSDGNLYSDQWNGSSWTGWTSRGTPTVGGISSDPVAVSWAPGREDVFAFDSSGTLSRIAWYSGTTWSGWTQDLGSGQPSNLVHALYPESWGPNRLDVFSRDTSGTLYDVGWAGSFWAWANHGQPATGTGSNPVAMSWSYNRIDIFVRDGSSPGQVEHQAWDGAWHPSQTTWQVDKTLPSGTTLTGQMAPISWGYNRLDVFARDTNGKLQELAYDGTQWYPWYSHGAPSPVLATDPQVTTWGVNRLDEVSLNGTDPTSATEYHVYWDSTYWYDWVSGHSPDNLGSPGT